MEKTFGLIKPEGLKYEEDIETRIKNIGLEIEEKKEVILSEDQFERIYGHAKPAIPNTYEDMKKYMITNPVIILKVTGENAIEKLLKLRGCSNAADAEPGTIRGDYAKDQDYKTLHTNGEFAKNVFHAADVKDVEDMIGIFFEDKLQSK